MNLYIDKTYLSSRRAPFFLLTRKYAGVNDKILDVGAGDASFAETLQRKDIYMFDGNQATVNEMKKKYANYHLGVLPNIPFPDNFFNIVHSSHVIEHLQPEDFYNCLKEMDRCLQPGGYLILSAPVLWTEFYDDLSHIKPYNIKIFEKYLCWGMNLCCTRPLISDRYEVVERVFRYSPVPFELSIINSYSKLVTALVTIIRRIVHALGFTAVEKSGFTIVLRKKI